MACGQKRSIVTVALAAALMFVLAGCSEPAAPPIAAPLLKTLSTNSATVTWQTGAEVEGKVLFRAAGTEDRPGIATEEFGAALEHEVVLKGLQPGARYEYWIAGSEARYQFRTEPLPSTPFSLLVVWGDDEQQVMGHVMRDMPELVLDFGACGPADHPLARHRELRSTLPVIAPLCNVTAHTLQTRRWAGLQFVQHAGGGRESFDKGIRCDGSHTIGLIDDLDSDKLFETDSADSAFEQSWRHGALLEHNRQSPSCPFAFALVSAQKPGLIERDGIRYLGVDTRAPGALRIDVTVESIRATDLETKQEHILKQPPLGDKRTCEECRRLADQGAYEASVKAYQQFIATHEGHFQIDDAMYAIASILDEKLFRHHEALEHYRQLLAAYGRGTLAPLARQRVAFLEQHADHDFAPLARFERIRRVEFARKRSRPAERAQVLGRVREILQEYPGCSLAPTMLYWLANQQREGEPDRAAATYRELIARFPADPFSSDARLEIGDTYYAAERFDEALAAFEAAMVALPDRAADARTQADRARRNLRRESLGVVSWIVLAALAVLGLALPPVGLARGKILRSVAGLLILGGLIAAGAWLVHEQFASSQQIVVLVAGLTLSAAAGFLFGSELGDKLLRAQHEDASRGRVFGATVLGAVLGLLFMAAGAYATMNLVDAHLLVVVGL